MNLRKDGIPNMANIYNGYMDDAERELCIQEAYFDNKLKKLNIMFEMVSLKLEGMYSDAEYKVLKESGTYDDLEYLYGVAVTEAGEDQRSIIQKIADAVTKFFQMIGQKISQLFSGKGAKGKVKCDKKAIISLDNLNKKSGEINGKLNELKGGISKKDVFIAGTAAAGLASLIAGLVIHNKKQGQAEDNLSDELVEVDADAVVQKAGIVKSIYDNIVGALDSLKSIINEKLGADSKVAEAGRKVLNTLKSIGSTLLIPVNKVMSAVGLGKKEEASAEEPTGQVAKDVAAGAKKLPREFKASNGAVYKVNMNNGKVFTKNGNVLTGIDPSAIADEKVKKNILKLVAKIQSEQKTEDADLDSLKMEFAQDGLALVVEGEDYIISQIEGEAPENVLESVEDEEVNEKAEEISTEDSIFGAGYTEEKLIEESAEFDKELEKLNQLFANI